MYEYRTFDPAVDGSRDDKRSVAQRATGVLGYVICKGLVACNFFCGMLLGALVVKCLNARTYDSV